MIELRTDDDGNVVADSSHYRLVVDARGEFATVSSPSGEHWASLRPHAALDTTDGPDETLSIYPPRVVASGTAVKVERRSTRWERASTTIAVADDSIELTTSVRGRGDLSDAHLLGARWLGPGFKPSGSSFRTLFSPNPADPGRILLRASEPATIGLTGDDQPGRGHWFFTPAPLSLWLTTSADVDEAAPAADGWVGLSLAAPIEQLSFVQLAYVAADRGFSLRLEYEGHTRVDGEFEAPLIVLTPGVADPYAGLRRYREDLSARGVAPAPACRDVPEWWTKPIFCGWGAQRHLAERNGGSASAFATQQSYDSFLDHLERQGLAPGTIVIDDKWQSAYGTNEPDADKWPDLRGWIAARHGRGQHVLLWWKAWDSEGVTPELCIRDTRGVPFALDPTNPALRDALRESVTKMLGREGLDADGLKVDFTAHAPSGSGLSAHGPGWGIALLHELLAVVYAAAKEAKHDALLVTQTPHPSFVDVTDMIRLNDMLRLNDLGPTPPIVPQMRYRAEVVRAACPELLIDTDDWCVPDRASWRKYLELKRDLGVPSLYYATHFDRTGEPLEREDYEALRRTWAAWK